MLFFFAVLLYLNDTYLDVVGDQHLAEVENLQHGHGAVVRDGVAFEDIACCGDLPRQPAQGEHGIDGQHARQVTYSATAAAWRSTHAAHYL